MMILWIYFLSTEWQFNKKKNLQRITCIFFFLIKNSFSCVFCLVKFKTLHFADFCKRRLDCIKNVVWFMIIHTTSRLISFTHPFESVVQSSFVPLHSSSLLSSVALSLSRSVGSLSARSQMEELTPGVNGSDFRELKMAEGTSLRLAF